MPERKDNFWKRLGSSLTNATLGAAMADSPAVMTASGWSRNPDGSMAQNSQDDVGVKRLRDNLAVLGGAASGITAGGFIGAYGIKPSFRALMNGLDYTMPSHWASKLAAKLALPYESAQGIGYAADMLVPATGHLTGAIKDVRKKNEAIKSGNQALVDYYRRRGVMNLIGTAADFIVPPLMEGAVGLWRKSRNLRNLSNAGVLGKYGNVADNLAMYHSGSGEGWDALNAMKNTNLKIVDKLKDGVADFVPGANTIRIPRKSHSYLELGPEYAEALMAHEGTHAIFDSWNLPLRSPVSVIGHGYYVPNMSNPQIGAFAPLVKSNRLGAWEASPEEFIAEMGFLRQLTGQNKAYTELSPFYKKRFNKYMSDRFNISKKEASDIMTSISGYYSDGGKLRGLAERLKARKDGAELVNKFKCGGKMYPGGGKFFRTNLQQESPMMYQPILPSVPDVPTPMRYEPQPHLGLYEYPSTTGMAESYPVTLPSRIPVAVSQNVSAPVVVGAPVENLFSDEAIARRALKQRYAESAFNDKAKSKAGAQGAWQIMPITLKDYLGRGRGKTGDLNDPEYNRKVRDWVMGIIPRDLREFWSESDSDRAKLAKLYAAYNWGAGNLRGFLRKKRDAGIDISNPDNWVDDLNPETRRYVKYLAFDEDIPDSTVYTNAAFEKAAAERGYASGGRIYIKPENRGKFTALKKRTGHSASWFKAHGTPAQKKMAVFALNSRKWKHGDGGFLENYYDDGGPYGVIPLGGDYLTYLQTVPEVSGGAIEPSVAIAALPSKFNGSQAAAARYAEGYQKGAKPVSEAMNRAGQDIFNTVDTVVGLTPTPAGAISWLGHMGADAAEGRWGRVGRDVALAAALGTGARGIGWLRNYVDDATNYGEDLFRAFTDRVPGRVSTNFTYAAPATRAVVEAAPAVANAASVPYEIADLGGGYMLKSLMRGNPLEKQISKNGTVNVNNVRALVGKGSKVEQAVVDKVLASEEFAGKKSIDYNRFRKAVQDELITYDRTPDTRWSDYGMGRIGQGMDGSPNARKAVLGAKTHMDRFSAIDVYGTPAERSSVRNLAFDLREGKISESDYDEKFNSIYNAFSDRIVGNSTPETFVFSSSRIPSGSAKHYDPNTLGHSRTYTSTDEPDVLHVMESQSDWAQQRKGGIQLMDMTEENFLNDKAYFEQLIGDLESKGIAEEEIAPFRDELSKLTKNYKDHFGYNSQNSQLNHLVDNYTSRQIQENLRYAAEKGQKKMRYPTRETAAKIEGYPKKSAVENNPEFNKLFKSLESEFAEKYSLMLPPRDIIMNHPNIRSYFSELGLDISDDTIKLIHDIRGLKPVDGYLPSHETILKKYSDFPKQFKKIFKGSDVRTVTDSKGNTWYEVDVPENYLRQEWAYEEGGSLILPKMMMDNHSPDKLRKAIANIKAKRMQ